MSNSEEDTPFVAPDPAELNTFFPGYEIDQLLATGGMGAVYRALQKSLDRTVALKILPKELSKDAAFCESFRAEAKAMGRLNHPNLIGVYDFGEVDEMLFIIMEYVPGQSLYHSAHGHAIDPAEVVRVVSCICNGLAHAHENGIIHRDIKPSNILLDLNSQPKIGDFGLAQPIEQKTQESEEIFGTPHYTAPEVVNAPHTVDYRADIFSVGVVLHEMLTGMLPAEDSRSPSTIARCDPRFDRIVKKATSPYPASRYANAAEMAKDLLAISAFGPKHAPLPAHFSAGQSIPRVAAPIKAKRIVQAKRSSGLSILLLLISAAMVGGIYFYHKTVGLPFFKTAEPIESISENPEPPPPAPEAIPESTPAPTPDELALPNTPLPPVANHTAGQEDKILLPKLDIDAFYHRARKIMQDRAKTQIGQYQKALANNLGGFESDMRRSVRNLGVGAGEQKKALDGNMITLREGGNRLPPDLAKTFDGLPDISELAPSYLSKQTVIDNAFRKTMSPQAAIYIIGMEKQIERSKAENDDAAIAILESEIKLTRENPEYFPNLMLGITTPQATADSNDWPDQGSDSLAPNAETNSLVLPPQPGD